MKLRRVALRDFRGITKREVAFPARGVTVVEGANETGKSSLLEAVSLLLDYKDSSKAQPVRDVKPVDRDVATRVEVEAEVGPTRFTCVKQFHRQTLTELTIHAPRSEQLTGDEAHERLQAIVDEGVDRDLLSALWFRQGQPLDRLELASSTSLAAALDAVAGGEPGDDALFARVSEAYETYWTPRSARPRPVLTAADDAVAQATADEAALAGRLAALEEDLAAAERLAARASRLEAALAELRPEDAALQAQRREVAERRATVERLEAERAAAQAESERAAEALASRRALLTRIDELTGAHAALAEDPAARDRRARLAAEREELGRRREAAKSARQAAATARRRASAAADDVALLERQSRLGDLEERRRRVDEARRAAEDAAALLAASALDEEGYEALRAAATEADLARRRLEADAPVLTVRALADVDVAIGEPGDPGKASPLPAGQERREAVPEAAVVRLGELAEVGLEPGTSLAELTAERDRAEEALATACQRYGVADLDDARARLAQRREAERDVAERDRAIAAALDGGSLSDLDAEITTLAEELAGRHARREGDRALPEDLDAARAAAETDAEAAREAEEQARLAQEALEGLEEAVAGLREEVSRADAEAEALATRLAEERATLDEARQRRDDASLAEAATAAVEAASAAEAACDEAAAALAALGPERVELLAESSAAALADHERDLAGTREEQGRVGERLRLRGEEGLGERLELARAERERAERERDRLRARADAARLLFERMEAARSAVREAYRAPLAEAIAGVGQLVYDEGFGVELDESLGVATRTLDGVTVPWSGLSSGAKEQLSLLVALATARLVAEEGVPLVLDDLLGYTDPARLRRVGALLAHAGRTQQIIVLTCLAERYRSVGGAEIVHLDDPA